MPDKDLQKEEIIKKYNLDDAKSNWKVSPSKFTTLVSNLPTNFKLLTEFMLGKDKPININDFTKNELVSIITLAEKQEENKLNVKNRKLKGQPENVTTVSGYDLKGRTKTFPDWVENNPYFTVMANSLSSPDYQVRTSLGKYDVEETPSSLIVKDAYDMNIKQRDLPKIGDRKNLSKILDYIRVDPEMAGEFISNIIRPNPKDSRKFDLVIPKRKPDQPSPRDTAYQASMQLEEKPKDNPRVKEKVPEGFDILKFDKGGDVAAQTDNLFGYTDEAVTKEVDKYKEDVNTELSFKDAATFVAEATPIIGDALAAKEVYDELQKDEPNYLLVGALGGAALVGLIPGLGDAAASAIKTGAKKALDTAKRIKVDPNALGSMGGNINLTPKAANSPDEPKIISFTKKKEDKELKDFNANLMLNISEQASKQAELVGELQEAGVYGNYQKGVRVQSQNYKGEALPPYTITGLSLNKVKLNNPNLKRTEDRLGIKFEYIEKDGDYYLPMLSVEQADGGKSQVYLDALKQRNTPIMDGPKKKIRYRDDIDPEVYDAFEELADIQRGKPELAMVEAQNILSGGVLPYALEHTGDLTHRMAEKGGVYGSEYVTPKVDRLLDSLFSEYGFEKEMLENIASNARFKYEKENPDISFDQYKKEYQESVNQALKKYAEEHKKVPVYNEMQLAGREAAVALGEGRYTDAGENLYKIKMALNDKNYAEKSMEFNPEIDFRNKPKDFNKGGAVMNEQMEMAFMQEGGLKDDGMDQDPVSGNEVPSGSMASEVRDDISAQLSEGEYVVPADVVRFFGVKFFEDLRTEAKMGLQSMEANGRIGGEPVQEPIEQDGTLSDEEFAMLLQRELQMAEGGMVPEINQPPISAPIQAAEGTLVPTKRFNPFRYAGLGSTLTPGYLPPAPPTEELPAVDTEESCQARGMVLGPNGVCVMPTVEPVAARGSDDDPAIPVETAEAKPWYEDDSTLFTDPSSYIEAQLGRGEIFDNPLMRAGALMAGPLGLVAGAANKIGDIEGIARSRAALEVARATGSLPAEEIERLQKLIDRDVQGNLLVDQDGKGFGIATGQNYLNDFAKNLGFADWSDATDQPDIFKVKAGDFAGVKFGSGLSNIYTGNPLKSTGVVSRDSDRTSDAGLSKVSSVQERIKTRLGREPTKADYDAARAKGENLLGERLKTTTPAAKPKLSASNNDSNRDPGPSAAERVAAAVAAGQTEAPKRADGKYSGSGRAEGGLMLKKKKPKKKK
jgi:hypothetical protein